MADEVNNAQLSVIVTTSSRLSDLIIKNGQLIFIKDKCRIALDFNDKRTFYNQITELDTDYERKSLPSPSTGYYFVIETAVLWFYQDGWVQVTMRPDDIIFVGAELPALGQEKKIYINKKKKEISIYDNEEDNYIIVADKTDDMDNLINTVTEDDINSLF